MTADLERARLARALSRVARRDDVALEEVYRRTSAKLLGVILRILHDRQEAEDVLQDVYITVWEKAGRFDPERASPITWLATIARNRAIDRVRLKRLATAPAEAADAVPDAAPLASAQLEASQDGARLHRCLEGLDPDRAKVVKTAFFEGLTYDALAQRLNVPLGTVKSWIRRSLMSLKACLEA